MMNKTFSLCVAWLLLVSCLFAVEYKDSEATHKELLLSTSRALFERIVLTRRWNASHSGVYVPVTKDTQPNPYIEDPLRDIKVSNTLTLTKINPAYMTRQLAALSASSGTIQVHLTSLKPIRPENIASSREQFRRVGRVHLPTVALSPTSSKQTSPCQLSWKKQFSTETWRLGEKQGVKSVSYIYPGKNI